MNGIVGWEKKGTGWQDEDRMNRIFLLGKRKDGMTG